MTATPIIGLQKQAAQGIVCSLKNHVSCHHMYVIPVQKRAEGVLEAKTAAATKTSKYSFAVGY